MPVQSKIAREELPVILKDEESETLVVLSVSKCPFFTFLDRFEISGIVSIVIWRAF